MKNVKLLSLSLVAVVAMMSGHVSAMEEASAVEADGDDLSSLGSAITDSDERMLYDEKQRAVRQWFKKNKHLRHDSIVGAGMPPRSNYRAGHPQAELTAQERINYALERDAALQERVADERALVGVPSYSLARFAPPITAKQHRAAAGKQKKFRAKKLKQQRKEARAASVLLRKFRAKRLKKQMQPVLRRMKKKRRAHMLELERERLMSAEQIARAERIAAAQSGLVVAPKTWVTSEAPSGSVEGSSPRELRSGPVLHGNLERFIAGGDDAIGAVESAESFDRRVREKRVF